MTQQRANGALHYTHYCGVGRLTMNQTRAGQMNGQAIEVYIINCAEHERTSLRARSCNPNPYGKAWEKKIEKVKEKEPGKEENL